MQLIDSGGGTPSHRVPNRLLGLRVLAVDDEPSNCRILQRLLKQAGCDPVVVESAAALEAELVAVGQAPPPRGAAQSVTTGLLRPFGVMLVDLSLGASSEDGVSLVRRLRAAGVTVPAVAVTGSSTSPVLASAGFTGFLGKPFALDDLITALRLAVGASLPPLSGSGTPHAASGGRRTSGPAAW